MLDFKVLQITRSRTDAVGTTTTYSFTWFSTLVSVATALGAIGSFGNFILALHRYLHGGN